jgi:kinetochore protein NDC80
LKDTGHSTFIGAHPPDGMKSTTTRKTLSGVDSSQLNARPHGSHGDALLKKPTVDAALTGKAATRVAQSRAHQTKPTPRRHSVYFSSGHTPSVDPRPLGDNAYINSCIRQLISFLSSHGYDASLSPKTLASPTAKEFASLALFLFRQADENFKFGSKTEDDVPTIFRQLRYPFQISKSALYAVGSQHTWPSLLTALTWLVQMYVYEEEVQQCQAKKAIPEPAVAFFEYASCSYQHFLSGDDATCNELEGEFNASQRERHSQISRGVTDLEKENAELEARLSSMVREPVHKTALQQEKETFENGVQQCEDDIATVETFLQSAKSDSVLARQTKITNSERLDVCRVALAQLRRQVSLQSVDATEAKTIDRDIEKQKESLSLLKQLHTDVDSRAHIARVEANDSLRDMEKSVQHYNAVARTLQIVPHTAKYANETNLEAEINPRAATLNAMVNLDFKETVRTTVKKIHDLHMQKKWNSEREFVNLEQSLQACQDTYDEKCDEANELASKAKRSESSYDAERRRLDDVLAKITKNIATIEAEVASLRNTSEDNAQETESALQSCQSEYDECAKFCGQERLAIQNMMLAALDALMGHKQLIGDALDTSSSNTFTAEGIQ